VAKLAITVGRQDAKFAAEQAPQRAGPVLKAVAEVRWQGALETVRRSPSGHHRSRGPSTRAGLARRRWRAGEHN